MPNVTTQEKIVKEITNIAPVPDHDVIVFKLVGDGKQYYSSLRPNEKFKKKSWLDRNSDLIGYAVSRDTNLNHEFSDKFMSGDQKGSFTINIIMVYRVSDPLVIVEKLSMDPLKRLKEEVTRILGGTVAGLGWTVITDNSRDIESIALQYESRDKSNSSGKLLPTNWERLKDFAKDLGIELNGIRFSLTLPEQSAEITVRTSPEREKIKQIEHEERLKDKDRRLEQQTKDEDAIDTIRQRQLQRESQENFQKTFDNVVSRIGNGIETPLAFKKALEELRIQSVYPLIMGDNENTIKHISGTSVNSAPTLSLPGPESTYLAKTLVQAFHVFSNLACEPQEKQRLFACILHLLGELSLGKEANEEIVEKYSEEFRVHFKYLLDSLDSEQEKFMLELQDIEVLRMRLT